MWYFYILQSVTHPEYFYKGSTGNIQRRILQHNKGETQSLRPYLPLRLVYYEAYLMEKSARHREKSVKNSGAVYGALMGRVKNDLQ